MNPNLLAELAHLFSVEALEADERHNYDESRRLWEISDEIYRRCLEKESA